MTATDIYTITANRLKTYKLFSDATIKAVAAFARKQATYATYEDFFKAVGITEPTLYVTKSGEGVPLIDIAAQKEQKGVLVLHLPMSNSLDPNQLYQVGTVAAVNPSYRVVAFGNPNVKPFAYRQQNLSFFNKVSIAFTHSLQPLVKAELDYLHSQNIEQPIHVGYSYGALKALIASYYTPKGKVKGVILVDPVAHARYPQQLVGNFISTIKPLGEYVNRTQVKTYLEARQEAARLVKGNRALLKPINLAIASMLARIDFIKFFEQVLEKQPQLSAVIAWGSKSELGNDAHMTVNLDPEYRKNPRIKGMRLENDTHAFANDIYLYAALVHEALLKD